MSHSHSHGDPLPKPLLYACGALCLFALVMTGFTSLTGIGAQKIEPGIAIETVNLVIRDGSNGEVEVLDHDTGILLANFGAGEGSFARITARSLAKKRLQFGYGSETPFQLTLQDDRQLLLSDPITGEILSLEAFGHGNAETFAQFLPSRRSI